MESYTPEKYREGEISLKAIIVGVQKWVSYLWGKWLTILLIGLIGAGLGVTYSFYKKPTYTAQLSLVLEESKGSSLGGFSGLASQFGLDLSGGGSGIFSGDNIMTFLLSRLMMEKTLLTTIQVEGKTVTLADHFIRMNNFQEKWEKIPRLKGLSYPAGMDRNKFSPQQDSILQELYSKLLLKHIEVKKPDKKLAFILVRTTTTDELFSKFFTERLVREATEFYVKTKTQRTQTNVNRLQATADSIQNLLNRKTYSVATMQDMNLNPAKNKAMVTTELEARDKFMLQTIYGEVVKNLEITKMAMLQESPIIQVVDTPILPLKKDRMGPIVGFILGGIIAGFLIVFWLISRKILKDIMQSPN